MSKLPPKLQEIVDDFASMTREEKLETLIAYAESFPSLPDWLKDYQVVGDGAEKDAHLMCPVKLTVRLPGGQEVQREVTYIISTAPNLTVSRKVF